MGVRVGVCWPWLCLLIVGVFSSYPSFWLLREQVLCSRSSLLSRTVPFITEFSIYSNSWYLPQSTIDLYLVHSDFSICTLFLSLSLCTCSVQHLKWSQGLWYQKRENVQFTLKQHPLMLPLWPFVLLLEFSNARGPFSSNHIKYFGKSLAGCFLEQKLTNGDQWGILELWIPQVILVKRL